MLMGLHDPGNDAVWSAFDARYRPLIVSFSKKLGPILNSAVRGDYVVTPAHLEGHRDLRFVGQDDRVECIFSDQFLNFIADYFREGRVYVDQQPIIV